MYKLSKFNVSFNNKDEHFMFNSHSGNFVKLNEDYYQSFENIKNGLLTEIPESHIRDFLNGGFVVEEEKDEFAIYKYLHNKNRFGSDKLSLTIATTLQCNFRCYYCYENHIEKYLGDDEEEDLKLFIKNNIKGKNGLRITWYGGEPLLNMDFIHKISTYAIEFTDSLGISYSAGLVSNGYLLNRQIAIDLVNKYKIKTVQITLDGGPETHNLSRILENGDDTFNEIIENIKEIYDIIKVTVRVNVSKDNVNDIHKLFDIIIGEGLNGKISIYLTPVLAYENTACQSITSCLSTEDFSKWEINLIEYARKIGLQNLGDYYPKSKGSGICGAVNSSSYVIDAFGDIFKCWHEVGHKELSVGNISDKKTISSNRLLKWMNWQLPKKCNSCNIMPLCKSRCPSLSLDSNTVECHQLKYNIKDVLFNYYTGENYKANITNEK